MAENSYFWDGSVTGDCGPYDDADMATFFRVICGSSGNEGVLQGWLNELEVTDGGGLNADVDTGAALVYGTWFESDAGETLALAANTAQTVIVRVSWAAQTARLAVTAVALVQNPGVTYEIPLATLTTGPATITVGPTDARDYCEFSTVAQDLSVYEDNIQDDAVTWGKQIDQTRRFFRAAGQLEPDGTNPAAWTSYIPTGSGSSSEYGFLLYRDMWQFADAVTDSVWCAFRVPEDITSATIEIFIWITRWWNAATGSAANQRWVYDLWSGASAAALANQTAATVIAETDNVAYLWRRVQRESLGTFTATAGDLVLFRLDRTGANVADTSDSTAFLMLVEFEYTADG